MSTAALLIKLETCIKIARNMEASTTANNHLTTLLSSISDDIALPALSYDYTTQ
jgi:hypothetical protein